MMGSSVILLYWDEFLMGYPVKTAFLAELVIRWTGNKLVARLILLKIAVPEVIRHPLK